MFAGEIRKRRVAHMRAYPQWRWHSDEVFVEVNGRLCYLWRAVDHEGEVLESIVTTKRDKPAALKVSLRQTARNFKNSLLISHVVPPNRSWSGRIACQQL
jgi:putative transposase